MLAVVRGSDLSFGLESAHTVPEFAAVADNAPDSLRVWTAEAIASVEVFEEYCSMVLREMAAGKVGLEMTG